MRQFHARVAGGRAITLIHGDFHFLGNVFFAPNDVRPKVIDWSEAKPGLGPHDLAYCLTVVPADDRLARDRVLLRRYWDGLRDAGVDDYSWELCDWDFRFSVFCNLFPVGLPAQREVVPQVAGRDRRTRRPHDARRTTSGALTSLGGKGGLYRAVAERWRGQQARLLCWTLARSVCVQIDRTHQLRSDHARLGRPQCS